MTDPLLLLVALTFLLAGFVKGVVGLGLPTVAMGLLGLAMAPAQAAALLVVPSLVTNLWQLFAGPRFGGLLRRLWPMMAGICLGTWAGAGPANRRRRRARHHRPRRGPGALRRDRPRPGPRFSVPARAERWWSALVGAATGLVTAATGVFVAPGGAVPAGAGAGEGGL